jgi:hypothetical protein
MPAHAMGLGAQEPGPGLHELVQRMQPPSEPQGLRNRMQTVMSLQLAPAQSVSGTTHNTIMSSFGATK